MSTKRKTDSTTNTQSTHEWQSIRCKVPVTDVDAHPTTDLAVLGLINGKIKLCQYENAKGERQVAVNQAFSDAHTRTVNFNSAHNEIYTSSSDGEVVLLKITESDVEKVKSWRTNNEKNGIQAFACWRENIFATADDTGAVTLWDKRKEDAIMTHSDCDDYISDMFIDEQGKYLVGCSSEGTMNAYNIRRKKLVTQSELFDSEFTCISKPMRRKMCAGSLNGVINIFNWEEFGNISDRFPVLQKKDISIDSCLAISDKLLLIGCGDGRIRVVNIQPNQLLGTLARPSLQFPVTKMVSTYDQKYVVTSVYNDSTVRFFDVQHLANVGLEEGPDMKDKKRKLTTFMDESNNFFLGLDDDPTAQQEPQATKERAIQAGLLSSSDEDEDGEESSGWTTDQDSDQETSDAASESSSDDDEKDTS